MNLPTPPRFGLRRMDARSRVEAHRVSTPLELLFDLVFVIAVSQASGTLHHLIVEGSAGQGTLSYLMVFFAIWWAWMNFSWFASAFDTDDWLYRVTTIVQMGGVLVLAAGVSTAMLGGDFTIVTIGYVIMRIAMVAQWLRVAVSDPDDRATALRMAAGVTAVQVLWVGRLFLDPVWGFWGFFALVILEVLIPVWAERKHPTAWHPEHITERYGLFTLLLLGESLLASSAGIFEALTAGEHVLELITLSVCGLVITAGLWWVYFARNQADGLTSVRAGFTFGYVHYMIFAAAGAVSAGIGVVVDVLTGDTQIGPLTAGVSATLPVCLFVLGVWAIALRTRIGQGASIRVVVLALLIGVAGMVPWSVAWTAVLLVVIVVTIEVDSAQAARRVTGSRPVR